MRRCDSLDFNKVVEDVKRHLNVNEIKALESELKDNSRLGKLHTEIYLLWKYSNSGLKIRRPHGTDCIIKTDMKEYQIEVYQPDTSKVKSLKNAKKEAKVNIIGKHEVTSYPYSTVLYDFLEEELSKAITNKKRKNQFLSSANKNILWVDMSDISLIDKLIIQDSDTLDFFDVNGIKSKLNKWDILSGVIFSMWEDGEKRGILLNKNLDNSDIDVISKAIRLEKII